MNKTSQIDLYKKLIESLGKTIDNSLKEEPEKLVHYYIYHWSRFKEAFPGKSILSLIDVEHLPLIDSFYHRFNNLRVKTLNKRIQEYKGKWVYDGKRGERAYKFYCLLKKTLIEERPDLIEWWSVIYSALTKKKYVLFDGFNFHNYYSTGSPCTLSNNFAKLYSWRTIKIYQNYQLGINNLYMLNTDQKTFKERFEIEFHQINPTTEENWVKIKKK